ncbi:MAG: glutathione transport system permease protein GsiD [Lachnospiraceae bacterium]|jgi:peptide/nickel transport system permease protein|nr:glutathione transport system permease protein GsiD [Lachnospiraceae bacterium]
MDTKNLDNFLENRSELSSIRKKLQKEQRQIRINAFLKNKLSVIGLVIVVIMILIAILAPMIATINPADMDVANRLKPPSTKHWFGTDDIGRDVYSRVIYGTRVSLFVGFSVSLISGVLGMIIGIYSSYNKILDNIFMRICDGLKSITSTLLAICLMAVLGASIKNVIISLALVNIPNIARVARSSAFVVREQTYIEAMHAIGAKPSRILWIHIAPNTLSPVIVQMTFVFASSIITEAALSFLGAGVPAGVPSWGSILNIGRSHIYNAWWLIIYPGLFTAISVLGLNLLGDGIRDLLDPLTN